ncbi:hypothetical protein [Prosthecochloris sp. GSB1]|uniref:hypothetical protein n=1 Tax=Prosthecochloris sp. GSB1 TaxID=281093 RepID=UPI001237666B|nr:hypothetical protein [Prosthecochloris sp. GSB1]
MTNYRYVRGFAAFFALSMLVAAGSFLLIPHAQGYFLEEDSLIENLTVLLSFFAFLLGVVYAFENPGERKYLLFIALCGFLGAMEELSFGERLLHLDMPQLGKYKLDGVHDLFYVTYKNVKNLSRSHGIIVYPVLAAAVLSLAVYLVRNTGKIRARITASQRADYVVLVIACVVMVLASQVVDLDEFDGDFLFMLEEMFELNAAAALIAACLSLDRRFAKARGIER